MVRLRRRTPRHTPAWFIHGARRSEASARTERAKAVSALASTSLDELAWRITGITGDAPRRTRSGLLTFVCPAHDDSHPSAWAAEGRNGVLVGCLAGCSPADVVAKLQVSR